jgi:hypothetical protein
MILILIEHQHPLTAIEIGHIIGSIHEICSAALAAYG